MLNRVNQIGHDFVALVELDVGVASLALHLVHSLTLSLRAIELHLADLFRVDSDHFRVDRHRVLALERERRSGSLLALVAHVVVARAQQRLQLRHFHHFLHRAILRRVNFAKILVHERVFVVADILLVTDLLHSA